jgi:predicted GNAT family acetyltransferase
MATISLELNEKNHGAFILLEDGEKMGEMVISIKDDQLTVYHTEVDPKAEGKGYAKILLAEMVKHAREQNLKVIPLCAFVLAQFKRHPEEYNDIWLKE